MIAITTSSSTNVKPQIERTALPRLSCASWLSAGGRTCQYLLSQMWTKSDGSRLWHTSIIAWPCTAARLQRLRACIASLVYINQGDIGTAKNPDRHKRQLMPEFRQQRSTRRARPWRTYSTAFAAIDRHSFVAVQFEHNAITWWNCHGHSRSIPIKGEILDIAGSRKDLSDRFAVRQWQLPAIFCVAAIQADQQRLAVVAAAESKEFRPTISFNKLDRPATQR